MVGGRIRIKNKYNLITKFKSTQFRLKMFCDNDEYWLMVLGSRWRRKKNKKLVRHQDIKDQFKVGWKGIMSISH